MTENSVGHQFLLVVTLIWHINGQFPPSSISWLCLDFQLFILSPFL